MRIVEFRLDQILRKNRQLDSAFHQHEQSVGRDMTPVHSDLEEAIEKVWILTQIFPLKSL